MQSAAPQEKPIWTLNSSQVFERLILRKQPKITNKKDKKLEQKDSQR